MVYSAVRVPAKKLPANAAVIILHGLGDSGAGWSFLADYARRVPKFDQVKFIFPNAPTQPVTCNMGMSIPSWFDIYDIPLTATAADVDGYLKACDIVKGLIKEQTDSGIPAERIILGGFSQGAALALGTAATLDYKIGGFLILSGFCPIPEIMKSKLNKINVDTPVYQAHGTADPVIGIDLARSTKALFAKEIGFTDLVYKEFPGMAHSTCEEELMDIFQFYSKVFK